MADIKMIRPGIELSTLAFLTKVTPHVPEARPVVVLWVNEDGSPEFRCNGTLRRDWAWLGAWLTHMATHGDDPA